MCIGGIGAGALFTVSGRSPNGVCSKTSFSIVISGRNSSGRWKSRSSTESHEILIGGEPQAARRKVVGSALRRPWRPSSV